jgi:hypothetical protein
MPNDVATTRPSAVYRPPPSPIGAEIALHRAELREIWDRHAREVAVWTATLLSYKSQATSLPRRKQRAA